jgi:hypothetical protein
MDTETVLQIIQMLDNRLATFNKELDKYSSFPMAYAEHLTIIKIRYNEAERFKEYLQDYIETQVSQAENNLAGGE